MPPYSSSGIIQVSRCPEILKCSENMCDRVCAEKISA